LAGHRFELITDHQPLLSIFSPVKGIPVATANRLQRWAICLMGYSYVIHYKPTRLHSNADALSRLPVGPDHSFVDKDALQVKSIQSEVIDNLPIDAVQVQAALNIDPSLSAVKQYTLTKWPKSIPNNMKANLIPFFHNRRSLSVVDDCLLRDARVVIPQSLWPRVLNMLHRTHLGVVKMKQLARQHCWWPGIETDITNLTKSCHVGATTASMPKETFQPWPEPEHVWSRVHMDFAGPVWGSKWFVLIDAESKFPFVADMGNDTTATSLCRVLDQAIDWLGPPDTLVSDNGPPFNSYEMKSFYTKYGIQHITTAPYHPASNGIAERFVRSFKEGMTKEHAAGTTSKHVALRNTLRTFRWTPHTTTGVPPADMLLQRPVRTSLSRLKPVTTPTPTPTTKYRIGQLIWAMNHQPNKRPQWLPAMIHETQGTMIHIVRLPDGRLLKRHQNQLRARHVSQSRSDDQNSLPDNLISPDHDPTTSSHHLRPTSPHHSQQKPRRYPDRIRKPPERY
jgi:transposase InsO family protein